MYDPKWFHDFKGKHYQFIDKRGVINGLRAEPFVPKMLEGNGECKGVKLCNYSPDSCEFLSNYYRQLKALDFEEILMRFEKIGNTIRNDLSLKDEPIAALLVYEAYSNPCSERVVIHKWFKENGYDIQEYLKI